MKLLLGVHKKGALVLYTGVVVKVGKRATTGHIMTQFFSINKILNPTILMYDDAGEWVFQYLDNKIDSVRVDAF